ncbi:MAG: GFA family protein [Beijerinckiaceae bacterium]
MAGFTGGCLCGAVRYEVDIDPVRMARCHCDDCRKGTGAQFATNVFVPAANFKVTGDVATYQSKTDAGNTMTRAFCPKCGSPVFGYSSAGGGVMRAIRAGSIDDPSFVKPAIEVFTKRMMACSVVDPDTQKFEAMPG